MLMWRRQPLQAGLFADEPSPRHDVDWTPDLDIFEGPNEFLLVLSVPGVGPEDLDVSVQGRTVTISGRRTLSLPPKVAAHLLESPRGRFERRIRFPANCDMEGIGTTLRDGQLVIRVPKATSVAVRVPVVPVEPDRR